MSGIGKAVLFLCVLFSLAALAWMVFLPSLVEREVRSATGFDANVGVLAANPFTGDVMVQGLSLRNPVGYPVPDFVELKELRAEANMYSWMVSDRLVIEDLSVNLPQVEIVRCSDGKSNVGEFLGALSRGPGAPRADGPQKASKPLHYLVKKLHLRLDRLVIADYSGPRDEVKTYSLNIDHTFSNVSQATQLLVPDVVRSLYSFALRRDAEQLLPGEFGRTLADTVGAAEHVGAKIKDAGQKTGEYLKGLFDKLEQSAKP